MSKVKEIMPEGITVDTKIEIRPIENRGNIREFSKNLEFFAPPHTISPSVDARTRKFKTGLSQEDKEYLSSQEFPYDISDNFIQGQPHPFWESQIIKVSLGNSPMFLYPGRSLIDFVKYKYLKESDFVYRSEEELKIGLKPSATHFIYDESTEMGLKARKIEIKNNVINKLANASLSRKRDIILILENEDVSGKGEDYFTVKFSEMLEDFNKTQELDKLLNKKVAEVSLEAEIKRAISYNVLRKTKKGIYFYETLLGHSIEELKEYLSKDENQETRLAIQEKIN